MSVHDDDADLRAIFSRVGVRRRVPAAANPGPGRRRAVRDPGHSRGLHPVRIVGLAVAMSVVVGGLGGLALSHRWNSSQAPSPPGVGAPATPAPAPTPSARATIALPSAPAAVPATVDSEYIYVTAGDGLDAVTTPQTRYDWAGRDVGTLTAPTSASSPGANKAPRNAVVATSPDGRAVLFGDRAVTDQLGHPLGRLPFGGGVLLEDDRHACQINATSTRELVVTGIDGSTIPVAPIPAATGQTQVEILGCSLRTRLAVVRVQAPPPPGSANGRPTVDYYGIDLGTGATTMHVPHGVEVVASGDAGIVAANTFDGSYTTFADNAATTLYSVADGRPIRTLQATRVLDLSFQGSEALVESGQLAGRLDVVTWRTGAVVWGETRNAKAGGAMLSEAFERAFVVALPAPGGAALLLIDGSGRVTQMATGMILGPGGRRI